MLVKGYYIRKFDSRNWVLAKRVVATKGKYIGHKVEEVFGYYADITNAWNGAINKLMLSSTCNSELAAIIGRLEKLKVKLIK